MFEYRIAITRKISDNFLRAEKSFEPEEAINLEVARTQHAEYVDALKALVPSVFQLPSLDAYPDCCFVEDCAEVVSPYAIVNRMGAPSRRGEELDIATLLEEANLEVMHLVGSAVADGGDMLYTTKHLFVGLSGRTNQAAIIQLKALLPYVEILPIQLDEGLHLKSFVTQLDEKILAVSDCRQGRKIANQLSHVTRDAYQFVYLPDVVASNVVRIGNSLLVQSGFQKSLEIYDKICTELKLTCVPLNMSELIKADGALSCCSILIPKEI